MKISLRWIDDFVEVSDYMDRASELAKLLTAAGLEVEAVENPAEALKSVVVGRIEKLDRHPNADRLTVCQVDVGDGTVRQIVCGAKNHKAGDKVAAALPGAMLPGDFAIKKSKIRDVESQGMLCSESELGLKKESEGILILPADAPVGVEFAKYFGLDDVLLEINVSPNRADCLSHLGLARELAALLNRPLKRREAAFKTDSSIGTKKSVRLEVKDVKHCPRYTGRVLTDVKVGPSPDLIRKRIEAVGMNSINNVVDITNYVMLELGQPLHAFDLDSISRGQVEVALSKPGEVFLSLDGSELKLTGDELTIRDAERAICIAGVIGGKNSGVSDKTTRVFLESAHFAMESVRRTSRRFGIQTDSAYRFSRGTDISAVMEASNLACSLLQKYAGAKVAADSYDDYPRALQRSPISITLAQLSDRLGYAAEGRGFTDWMKRIGCRVELQGEAFLVTPPEYRADIEMKEDLIEEFGRLQGYDRIPEVLPLFGSVPLRHAEEFVFDGQVHRAMEDEGWNQAINYGFISAKFQNEFVGARSQWTATGLSIPENPVMLRNPLNEDLNAMRISLAPGLFRNAIYNFRHGMSDGRIYESGFVFRREEDGYVQSQHLALIGWGTSSGLWQRVKVEPYFDLKTAIENVCHRLRVGSPKGALKSVAFQSLEFRTTESLPQFLHPAQAAVIFCEGKNIGYVGSLHPRILAEEKFSASMAIAELNLAPLRRGQPRPLKYQAISKQPAVERDFAFLVPKAVTSAAIATEIRKIAGPLLQSSEVFDLFEGGNLPSDMRSIAFRLVFQDPQTTLTEPQLQTLQSDIVAGLDRKLGVRVR